ncbi:MAG: hypothetical protein WDN10_01615 [bacterium]
MDVLNNFLKTVVVQIVNPLLMLIAAAAFLIFLWGVFKFVANAGDETAREEGRSSILWGLVGLVIIFGVFGILGVITGTFGIPSVPKFTS